MENHGDIISFVYSDNGTYFFQRLHREVEQMREKDLPLEGSHYIGELEMTLSQALALAVSATFAIQDEFVKKDHHKDFDAWRGKHPQEDMDYQTWINKSLVYQLDELKLTDINRALGGMGVSRREEEGESRSPIEKKPVEKKKKKRGFWGKR